MSIDNIDLACAMPADDAQWQRQCEIEQQAAHAFFIQRAKAGHSIPATVFATIVVAGLTARAFFNAEASDEVCEMLCACIRANFKED